MADGIDETTLYFSPPGSRLTPARAPARASVLWLIVFSMVGVIIMPQRVPAEELTLDREVIAEAGLSVVPHTIARARNGEFVVAGSLYRMKEAWATRIDELGNVKWRYVLPGPDQSLFGSDPEYQSAVMLPDDSVMLCGYMTGLKGESWHGLITHLDSAGRVLRERVFAPPGDSKFGTSRFFSCALRADGLVVVVGSTSKSEIVQPTPEQPLPYIGHYFYWILAIDQRGQTKWERLIPVPDSRVGGPDWISPIQFTADDGFIFATRRLTTEIVHIDAHGEVVQRR